jgi:hypothetical protein
MIELSHQEDILLRLLEDDIDRWVPLPRIMATGIAQYNARLLGLRRKLRGQYRIENRTEVINGKKHSWYKLTTESRPVAFNKMSSNPQPQQQPEATLFDMSPRMQYPD